MLTHSPPNEFQGELHYEPLDKVQDPVLDKPCYFLPALVYLNLLILLALVVEAPANLINHTYAFTRPPQCVCPAMRSALDLLEPELPHHHQPEVALADTSNQADLQDPTNPLFLGA